MITSRALMDRLATWWAERRGMSRADRARWEACASLADVARLTAAWLRGEIASQPGYIGRSDVDEDVVRGMAELLAAVNDAGFLTNSSQAGVVASNTGWVQLAAVSGFATPEVLARLRAVVDRHPELSLVECRKASAFGTDPVCPVTFRHGYPWTDFGNAMPVGDIRDDWTGYGMCRPEAVAEVLAAQQVVIVDRLAGRNEILWPALAEFAGSDTHMWLVNLWTRGPGRPIP